MIDTVALYSQDTVDVYARTIRRDILPLLDKPYLRVLDVGCNTGATGAMLLEERLCSHVTGIELLEAPAQQAAQRLNRVVNAPVESALHELADELFDCILALDVLEHLVDPWTVTSQLSKLLAPGGVLIVSLPNIRNWQPIRDLLFRGEWKYVESGILDRTHLRFFTKSSMLSMVESTSLETEAVRPTGSPLLSAMPFRVPFGIVEEFLAPQYLIRCRNLPQGTRR